MRERLVLAFVGLTLAVIGLYGVPRAYFLADLVREQHAATLDATGAALAGAIEERTAAGGSVDPELLETGLSGADRVEYVPATGGPVSVGEPTDDGVEVTRSLPGGDTLRLSVSGETVSAGVQEAITPLLLIGTALSVLSAALGFALARRMSRPFRDLARFSRALGHGRFDIEVPSYSVPEAEAIGASLRSAAAQLDELLRREREFAANASHQLRTPITALRLNLEDLTLWPETDPAVAAEITTGLTELDRLAASIDELLDLARGRRLDAREEIDLAALARANASRWKRRLAADGRVLRTVTSDPARTRVPVGPVEQVLDVLIDNARVHGRGAITLEVRDAGTHLEIAVADEGTSRLGPAVFRRGVSSRDGASGGIGLAVAAELAEVCGGHLSLDTAAATTRFVLWLPRHTTT